MTVKMATERQAAFIARLLDQRDVGDDKAAERLRQLVSSNGIDTRTASKAIEWLLARPRKPADDERPNGDLAGLGVYQRDGRVYVVREFKPDHEDRKVRFAREIVTLRDSQGDRLALDGEHVRYEEVKAPGMQWKLLDSELVPMDELSRLGVQFGHCIVCGTVLEVAESIERGIGPVCAKRQQARLGGAA